MPGIIKKGLVLLPLFLLWVASPAFSLEQIAIPCEVMEVSKSFESSSSKLIGIRYILLHHAHSEDRQTLSKWLMAHSGTEVTFIVDEREYKGILFRLAHCFGRGLLIYAEDVSPEKGDIIKVILSPPP
jgi:hydrogenase maturation factor